MKTNFKASASSDINYSGNKMDISGQDPLKPTYQSDFKRSVELFEKSFKGMRDSSLDAQRNQYAKAMHELLQTMQEAANGMFKQNLVTMKENLSKDLEAYLDNPTDVQLEEKVQADINQLKKQL